MIISYFNIDIERLGRFASESAELVGRNQCNAHDIHLAFVHLGMDIRGMKAYIKETIPMFETAIPIYPLQPKVVEVKQNLLSSYTYPRPEYIPDYLPPFPADHTFMESKVYNESKISEGSIRAKKAEQSRQVERGLSKFVTKTNFPTHPLHAIVNNEQISLDA
eukprot:Pgem_evm2s716